MRDGWWGGKPQIMNFVNRYLREWSLCWMWTLGTCDVRGHPDSSMRSPRLSTIWVISSLHALPKFHCELNPIERVWAQVKRYIIPRHTVNPTYKVLWQYCPGTRHCHNHFRKVTYYMFAYLEGLPGGSELESKHITIEYQSISDTTTIVINLSAE